MPFQKGNQLGRGAGGGRKGYQYEKEQLKEMRKLVTEYINLGKKILSGDEKSAMSQIRFETVGRLCLKAMDKLHANKQDITSDGERVETTILYVPRDESTEEDIKTE